jgi:hypothetical protein
MDQKIIAAIVATAIAVEAIFSPQDDLPHTDVDANPQTGRDFASIHGRRLNDGLKLTLIPRNERWRT